MEEEQQEEFALVKPLCRTAFEMKKDIVAQAWASHERVKEHVLFYKPINPVTSGLYDIVGNTEKRIKRFRECVLKIGRDF